MPRLTDPLKLDTSRGFPTCLRTADGALLGEIGNRNFAERIKAALDACHGISTEDLRVAGRLAAAEEATLRRLQNQRDELLAALKEARFELANTLCVLALNDPAPSRAGVEMVIDSAVQDSALGRMNAAVASAEAAK